MVVTTATTIGYGDTVPTSDAAKIFAIVYLPMLTLSLAKCVGDYSARQVEKRAKELHNRVLRARIDEHTFKSFDVNQVSA